MKYLKPFNESKSNKEIHTICKMYDIKNYTIVDGMVNVNDSVYLNSKNLTELPLQFGAIAGSFYCTNNNLITLKGAPYEVGGAFYCNNNELTTLEYGPKDVGQGYYCDSNQLTSLKGAPKKIKEFRCSNNQLTTLEGAPLKVLIFNCNNNLLTSFDGLPDVTIFRCYDNPISKWWNKIDDGDINKLNAFLDMNINAEDPDEVNQQKIDYLLNY